MIIITNTENIPHDSNGFMTREAFEALIAEHAPRLLVREMIRKEEGDQAADDWYEGDDQ